MNLFILPVLHDFMNKVPLMFFYQFTAFIPEIGNLRYYY